MIVMFYFRTSTKKCTTFSQPAVPSTGLDSGSQEAELFIRFSLVNFALFNNSSLPKSGLRPVWKPHNLRFSNSDVGILWPRLTERVHFGVDCSKDSQSVYSATHNHFTTLNSDFCPHSHFLYLASCNIFLSSRSFWRTTRFRVCWWSGRTRTLPTAAVLVVCASEWAELMLSTSWPGSPGNSNVLR